jgi:hypothetical protein
MSVTTLRKAYLSTGEILPDDIDGYAAFAQNPASQGIYYSTVRLIAAKN